MLTLLFTGCSGAGKSTLAQALAEKLEQEAVKVAVIDGDEYRHTLNKDLGFSEADRRENVRRLMQVAVDKNKEGSIAIVAAINPFEDQRQQLHTDTGAFIIYINCSLNILIKRDTKGLYKRALLPDGHPDKINNLTGVNDRYDIPLHPHLAIDTGNMSINAAVAELYQFVRSTLQPNE